MKLLIIFWTALIVSIKASKYDSFVHPLSDEFIDLVNEKATTWKAGRNFPKETSMKYIKRLMGALEPKYSSRPTLVQNIPDFFVLPDNFDAREAFPQCSTIGEIADQGNCGSSWATAAVGIMSDRTCISSNGEKNFHYSVEDVITCCYSCSPWGSGCASGGWTDAAFEYWILRGIVSGGLYNSSQGCSPYQIQPCEHHMNGSRVQCENLDVPITTCEQTCQPAYNVAYKDDKHFGKKRYYIRCVKDAQYELIKVGPFKVSLTIYEDFLSYKSGVYYYMTGHEVGSHAVRVIGYGTEDGVDYWLCANSWNTDWGDNGFFKILRGTNECGIERHMEAAIPK